MKKYLLVLLVGLFYSLPVKAEPEKAVFLEFKPGLMIGGGINYGPLWFRGDFAAYATAKAYWVREFLSDKADLLGVGISYDTDEKTDLVLSPFRYYMSPIFIAPDFHLGLGDSHFKIGLSVGIGF